MKEDAHLLERETYDEYRRRDTEFSWKVNRNFRTS